MNVSYIKKEVCNVFFEKFTDPQLLTFLRGLCPDKEIYKEPNGGPIFIKGNGCEIQIFRLRAREDQEKWAKVKAGALSYVRNISTEFEGNKKFLIQHLSFSETSMGFKFLPGIHESNDHQEILLAITEKVSGIIFNGDDMIDCYGEVVLDSSGRAGVIYESA